MCKGVAQFWTVVEDKQVTVLEMVEKNTLVAWWTGVATAETR
jgi:hypothetical protein